MIPFSNNSPASRHRHYNQDHYRRQSPPRPALQFHHHHHNHQQRQLQGRQFVLKLLSLDHQHHCQGNSSIESLVSKCNPNPYKSFFNYSGPVSARLIFGQRADALDAFVSFWERRLSGDHLFDLVVDFGVTEDANGRMKDLFRFHVEKLLEGELVKKLEKKVHDLSVEIEKLAGLLAKPKPLRVLGELRARKSTLMAEGDGIVRRIEEFKRGMKCLLDSLEWNESKELGVLSVSHDEGFNWSKLHCLVLRECRRLEDGLPIYGYRTQILEKIHLHQVMVLIGETGSGKSTQLVQFLADSGFAAGGSILCTQPRKIAAISLTKRVGEESSGCYEDNSIVCHPTYSSTQGFNSKVVYMTDHCLLQHLMKDSNLSGVSCIIVDEAHERSLNTDLLLALIKGLLRKRLDRPGPRLIIMSATVDASKLSEYFFGCETFHVLGRSFPVEIKYVPGASGGFSGQLPSFNNVAPYVSHVVKMAKEIHELEEEGAILAFLTSQMEVEWATEKFQSPSAVALALHGKLSHEEQCRVFQNYPGKRKVIFATNLAETSLTIPGVKYVVDSGMAKESRFEPTSGMNVLRVSKISQSSASQRAGRAGRTSPGKCYRLYSESDFESMALHHEPEICKVHLGVAVLRIIASGFKNVLEFDFVDAPSVEAVDMAIRNLVQLGAITHKNEVFELSSDGKYLVKLGIEPRLGKIILESFRYGLHKEGVILAAVMATASSIFCRVGTYDDKLKSDSLKVRFCHHDGDLFTFLSVYREWESILPENRNKWCWDNSVNAKTMRRCKESVQDLENCLKNELGIIIPSYWHWNPTNVTLHDKNMKKIILSALAENIAMYSGYDRLGYEVIFSREYFQLHPSCSLQMYDQKPNWVVFSELLSISSQYLVCVTAVESDSLCATSPPLIDVLTLESRKLQSRVIKGFGSVVLKRFCGKSNITLHSLISRLQTIFKDERIGIEVSVDNNEIHLFASSEDIDNAYGFVQKAIECETKLLSNECLEKCLYHGGRAGACPPIALFGSGAEIKHLELENRCLTVDIYISNVNALDDKEVLTFFQESVSGVCGFYKFLVNGQDGDDAERWGKVTFMTPEAAERALQFNGFELSGSLIKLAPLQSSFGGHRKSASFPAMKAKVMWPRRYSKGCAIVRCEKGDAPIVANDCFNLLIGGRFVHCELSTKDMDCIVIRGLDRESSEPAILEALQAATNRRILDVFLLRGDAINNPAVAACEEAILKEIAPFMPNQGPCSNYCQVQVFHPEPKDSFMKAGITFDGRLHLEAAKALQHIQGKVLPCCFSWQKLQCQQVFHSSVSCPAPVYGYIEWQLNSLLRSFKGRSGVHCSLERNENGSCRVKISANATKTVAEVRRPFEQVMNGKVVKHGGLSPKVLQSLFSRDGIILMKSLQQEYGTYILFDRQNLSIRIFGPEHKVTLTEQKMVQSLIALHDNEQTHVSLRGGGRPHDLLKKVVEKFGPDLHGLKEKFPEVEFTLNTRRHAISFYGKKDVRLRVEEVVHDFVRSLTVSGTAKQSEDEVILCPVCLCEVEDCYQLEACGHKFCRSCLVSQLESALRGHDGFPIWCAHEGCGVHIWLADLKSLLPGERLEDLFRASLGAFVASSGGTYRFCPSPDCPSIYQVSGNGTIGYPFVCGACYAETCRRCHLEYHPFVSCERYKEFKEDPDTSLKEWCKGKEHVKSCPVCGYIIEKVDGCNHVECICGKHICWVCSLSFSSSDACYGHLRSVHLALI